MTSVTTKMTMQCKLANGKSITLTTEDCVQILNAMARRRLLTVMAEDVPQGYSEIWSDECCAWNQPTEAGEDEIILAVNTADFVCATPAKARPAKKASKKASKKK